MSNNQTIFRAEAVAHHLREPDSLGVIKASPPWTWFILFVSTSLILVAVLFLSFTVIDVPIRTEGMVQVQKNGAEVVAYTRDAPDGLRQGKRVRMELRGYPRARFEFIEGRIARIAPIVEHPGRTSAHALMRIDITLVQTSNAPLATAGLRDGMPVRVLLASRKVRLITLIRDNLL